MDDVPVGVAKPGTSQMTEEFANQAQSSADASGPLEERIVSKNWSIRAQAFDDLCMIFKKCNTQFDQCFKDHACMWKKYLNDANPGSLEKCLDSLEVFIDRAEPKVVSLYMNDIIRVLIEKCISHAKASIKSKSLECFALLFEVSEAFDDSVEVIIESLNSKQQKISQSAMVALNAWLSSYGVKKIKVKPFLPIIEALSSSSNPIFRLESMNFYKECYKWLGEALKPLIQGLKKQQLDDLEKDFKEINEKPKAPLRMTRSEKQKEKDDLINGIIKKQEEEKKIDVFDLSDPVDILGKFNNEWQDKIIELKVWKEKKEMLDELITECNVIKIKNGDFLGLAKVLKKLMTDANVVVSQAAVKACGSLAKGLRTDFEVCAKELTGILISRFKEKKTLLIDEVNVVLEHFLGCVNIEMILQDLLAALNDKFPSVKKNICQFIEKAAQQTYIDVLQRVSGELISTLMKLSDDQASDIRDAALSTLGIFKGRLGDSAMSKYLDDLNALKKEKLNESALRVQPSIYDKPEKKIMPVAIANKGKAQVAAPIKKKPVIIAPKKEEVKIQEEDLAVTILQPQYSPSINDDERPIGSSKFDDDRPLGSNPSSSNQFDDIPLGPKKGGYNLDDIDMQDAFGGGPTQTAVVKQIKKAPVKFQKQSNEEDKESGDINMDDDVMMSPKKVIPKSTRPPTSKTESNKSIVTVKQAIKTTQGGTNQEEEAGGVGLSKEEAETKVNETFNAEFVGKMEESKWQDKQEGFKGIGQQIIEMQPPSDVIEALAKYVKMKMKDWKESNVNLVKETIELFTIVSQNCPKINKRAVSCLMPFLSDKIGDPKVQKTVQELLLSLAELVTPKFVALQIIKYANTAKSPNTLKESCTILTTMTDEFSVLQMPLKDMIDYSITSANHQNVAVRTAAMSLFSMMFKHAGDPIRSFLKDIKESTLKLIEEEFSKVVPLKKGEHISKRQLKGEAAEQEAAAQPGKKGGQSAVNNMLDDALPRQDISKHLNPKLMAMFKNQTWTVRKEAADKVEEILKQSNMRIQPIGLTELMDNLKQRMSDPNKAVLKSFVQLICSIVEALGPASKNLAKKLLPALLQNLADKQSLVRQDVIGAMDKWAEHAGPEVVINFVCPMVIQENPELRTEALKWVIKNNESIKNCELKELVKPLVSCLSDKTPAIRSMGDEVICYVMPLTGYPLFQQSLTDLLPAIQNQIKPILDKIKTKVGASSAAPAENMNSSLGQKGGQAPASAQQKQEGSNSNNNSLKQQIKPKTSSNLVIESIQPKLNQSVVQPSLLKKKEFSTPAPINQRADSKDVPRNKGFGMSIISQPKEEMITEGLVVNVGFKEKRADYDKKNKFQLDEMKGDQIDKLKNFTTQCVGRPFMDKMFSNDFKLHCECIDQFNLLISENPDAIIDILDIIFKWSFVRLADSNNTKFAVNVFDFLAILFQHLQNTEYLLCDFEALVIIPLLCDKTGLNNNILKEKIKKLIKMVYSIYDKQRCYNMLVQYGLNSKNLRAVCECLDEMAEFIKAFGIDYSSEKELKLVSKMADHADKSIRENALKMMGEAYNHLEENIWRVIGDVTPKVLGLLEQRFKKLKHGERATLASSNSSSNIFKPESASLTGGQSPKAFKDIGFKTQGSFGVKKSSAFAHSDQAKLSTTPRAAGSQFNKSIGKQDQEPANFSKSINKLGSSLNSKEEVKNTQSTISKKIETDKQMNFDSNLAQNIQLKQVPFTQRPELVQNDFGKVEPKKPVFEKLEQQKQRQQTPAQNNQIFYQNDEEDDEELRILTSDANFDRDPELDKQQHEITKHIHQLKYGDLSKRVDSLVSLNEMISAIDQNKVALIRTANELTNAFTHVLNDIFERNVEDIPLRFAKYFINIVQKACSCKEIMREVSEEKIFELAEQLLTRLLIENLDKVGDNKEGELILKNLNSSMLRLLENCNHTYIFCVLFNLLRRYKDYPLMPKLPNLIIKCLLKLSKILEKLIDKLDMEKILLAIHEYLVVINHDNKTQNDEMGIRIVKTVTNELVKLKRESIWEAYRVIQCHNQPDNHIYRWIQIILKSLQTQSSGSDLQLIDSSTSQSEQEIKQIVDELRNSQMFDVAIPKLYDFLEKNPQIELSNYLVNCSTTFQGFIKTSLEKYRASMIQEENKSQETGMMMDFKKIENVELEVHSQPQELELQKQGSSGPQTMSRLASYQTKLASIKERNQKNGSSTTTNKDVPKTAQQQQMNTSFSAMNSSLSQKWNEINKKSNTKREGLQNMSNTMGGVAQVSQIENRIGKGQNAPMNLSIGANSSGQQQDQNMAGATNQDLNKRLAEMKAKLQALKKK